MTTKVPAGNATAVNEALTRLNLVWAGGSNAVVVAPPEDKVSNGWVVELPPYEYDNYILRQLTQFTAHVNKFGLPEWDNITVYSNKSYVRGSNGIIYVSTINDNVGINPTTVGVTAWVQAFEPYGGLALLDDRFRIFREQEYPSLVGVDPTQGRNRLSVYSRQDVIDGFAKIYGDAANNFSVANPVISSHAVNLQTLNAMMATTLSLAVGEDIQGLTDNSANVALSAKSAAQLYFKKANALSELDSDAKRATARTNLGLGSMATQDDAAYFKIANNLSELNTTAKKSAARNNLGLGSIATISDSDVFKIANNFSELNTSIKKSTARGNLGLGNSAVRNISTGVGGVAASDDSRIVNAVQNNYIVEALAGLVGGGALNSGTGKTSIRLGTPSTISKTSSNNVSSESHSHAIDILSFFASEVSPSGNGYITMPNGIMIQWGVYVESLNSSDDRDWTYPFPNKCFGFIPVTTRPPSSNTEAGGRAISWNKDTFVFTAGNAYGSQSAFVIAIGN